MFSGLARATENVIKQFFLLRNKPVEGAENLLWRYLTSASSVLIYRRRGKENPERFRLAERSSFGRQVICGEELRA